MNAGGIANSASTSAEINRPPERSAERIWLLPEILGPDWTQACQILPKQPMLAAWAP